MAKYPFGTTFAYGEYLELLRKLGGAGKAVEVPLTNSDSTGIRSPRGILHTHTCDVHYPDNSIGSCKYERVQPQYHRFHYHDDVGKIIAYTALNGKLSNEVGILETEMRNRASEGYHEAVQNELRGYFMRASEDKNSNPPRLKRPKLYKYKVDEAKKLSGSYALVDRCNGRKFYGPFPEMKEANAYYRELIKTHTGNGEAINTDLAVMCFNRLDRCWEIPIRNPLYGDFPHLRRTG